MFARTGKVLEQIQSNQRISKAASTPPQLRHLARRAGQACQCCWCCQPGHTRPRFQTAPQPAERLESLGGVLTPGWGYFPRLYGAAPPAQSSSLSKSRQSSCAHDAAKRDSLLGKKFPKFYNCVVKVKTKLSLIDLFETIKKIEIFIGRKSAPRNYPRKCDIDIIDFKGLYLKQELKGQKIETPHPRMHARNFVIFPLYEVDKSWIHPKTKEKINKLISHFSNKDFSDIRIV